MAAEDLARFPAKAGEIEKRPAGFQVDEQVDVALGPRLATSHGTEDPQLEDAVSSGGVE